jgi:hypothetical protein
MLVESSSASSFESSVNYAAKGITLLPKGKWMKHSTLSLRICSMCAEVEGLLGRANAMEVQCNDVISQKSVNTLDKVGVYHALSMRGEMEGSHGKPENSASVF